MTTGPAELCGASTLVKDDGKRLYAAGLRCKCWHCPECAQERKRELVALIVYGQPNAMLTFTLKRRKGENVVKAAYRLKRHVRQAIRLLRKELRTQFAYVEVGEAHESGYLHVHVAVRGWKYFHHEKLKAMWWKLTGDSWSANIDAIEPGKAAYYVTKYMGKEPAKWGKLKRYVVSKNWPRADKVNKPVFTRYERVYTVNKTLNIWINHKITQGYVIESSLKRQAVLRMPT